MVLVQNVLQDGGIRYGRRTSYRYLLTPPVDTPIVFFVIVSPCCVSVCHLGEDVTAVATVQSIIHDVWGTTKVHLYLVLTGSLYLREGKTHATSSLVTRARRHLVQLLG